ncbi:MAG: hypothetical protein QQN41_09820 [Nitrosopumilus sp.]
MPNDNNICALCHSSGNLCQGHIIPKFASDWLKESGITPFLRYANIPNVRKQDGPKHNILCKRCERLLSVYEKKFSQLIFKPYHYSPKNLYPYGIWLHYFVVSVLWRGCVVEYPEIKNEINLKFVYPIETAMEDWRKYLLGLTSPNQEFSIHIFLTDIIESMENIPYNFMNRYFCRSNDLYIAEFDDLCFIYVKLGRILLFGFFTDICENDFKNTKINPYGGDIKIPQSITDLSIGSFLLNRAKFAVDLYLNGLSHKQDELIQKSILMNIKSSYQKDDFKIIVADLLQNRVNKIN